VSATLFAVSVVLFIRRRPFYVNRLMPPVWLREARNIRISKRSLYLAGITLATVLFLPHLLGCIGLAITNIFQTRPIVEPNPISQMWRISPWFLLTMVTILPIFEEWLFRYTIFEEAKKRWGTIKSIFITSFLFGAVHLLNPGYLPHYIIIPFVSGIIFSCMYILGGLKMSIACHSGTNLMAFLGLLV